MHRWKFNLNAFNDHCFLFVAAHQVMQHTHMQRKGQKGPFGFLQKLMLMLTSWSTINSFFIGKKPFKYVSN